MKYGSLFSGIGGLDLAVGRVFGAEPAWLCEKDPYAREVLSKHWPSTHIYDDIALADKQTPKVDILCGGFPCNDLSYAGGLAGIHGKQSGLWWEMLRVIRELKPQFVVVENVSGLLAHLGVVLGPLAMLGFDAQWESCWAAEAGAPHLRERVFLLAYTRAVRREVELIGGAVNSQRSPSGDNADGCHLFPPPRDSEGWDAWAGPEPGVRRISYGVPKGVDSRRRRSRIGCLGNAVVPQQAEKALREMLTRV